MRGKGREGGRGVFGYGLVIGDGYVYLSNTCMGLVKDKGWELDLD